MYLFIHSFEKILSTTSMPSSMHDAANSVDIHNPALRSIISSVIFFHIMVYQRDIDYSSLTAVH